MKLFLKILAGIAILFIVALIGLNLYLTDERLRGLVVPPMNEALGREVQLDRISFTFFRTFPRFGLQMQGFELPGIDSEEPVVSFDRLTVAVKLPPLLRDEIDITRLDVENPEIRYRVYADSTTNIDFLLTEEEETPAEEEMAFRIQVPSLQIHGGSLDYRDETSNLSASLSGLDAQIGFVFADLIETELDAQLESLSVYSDGSALVENLPLQLQQTSTLNLTDEELSLQESRLSIRGFTLNLDGAVRGWSRDEPIIDLQFRSSSEDFGELLGLVPEEYEEMLQGIESGGSLQLEGFVRGALSEETLPEFEVIARIEEGWLRNPDLEEPIEQIHLSLEARNSSVALHEFRATASGNRIEASGRVDQPFEEDAPFSFQLSGDLDLATISQFYPIEEFGVEQLAGTLTTQAEGEGRLDQIEAVQFSGIFNLSDGLLKYADVEQPIEQVEAVINASQDRVDIQSASLRAAGNQFSASGSVLEPLADLPTFDIDANLSFDLGTIRNFYPIDEDTLMLRGQLTASASLRGQADQLEQALQESRIELRDGYISHSLTTYPLEDITFSGGAGNRMITIEEARFRTGENRFSMSGQIRDYLEDSPVFDLQLEGEGVLADVTNYYSLEPWINELTGQARMNLRATGPAGDPTAIALDGTMELESVTASGDSLFLPVSNLGGRLQITPDRMNLEQFSMNYGRSDIGLQGELENYLGLMEEHETEQTMPSISGSYHSRLLDMDEMIDWDAETEEEPILIELPQMTGAVSAQIDSLIIFESVITNIEGEGTLGPDQLTITEATADLFEGSAAGQLAWNVPRPDRTDIKFVGELNELQVESFFREFAIFGENSRFEEYLTGAFSAEVDYFSELDEYISPDITTTEASGSFGMTRARLRGHPVQEQLAQWLGADELRSMALDEWTALFTIQDSVLELEDFRLTSEEIGIELEGTQHLVTDEIDFTADLFLPSRFRSGLSSVLSSQVVDALSRDDGIIVIPIRISGTMESPRITPRETVIEDLLQDTIRDRGGDLIRGLFGR